MRRLGAGALLVGLAACATKGQVRLLEGELRAMRIETARRDSVRAAALAAVLQLNQRILDSLAVGRQALQALDTRMQGDITDIQRQLYQVQELTGQSQRRLSELKSQLDTRAEQVEAAGGASPPVPGDTAGRAAPAPPTASADQMYQGARQQLTRGALGTARRGFQEFLRVYPSHGLVPDALLGVGESFVMEAPDSAAAYYQSVVTRFPQSAAAPTALYRMGRLEEDVRKNPAAARSHYERLLKDYPRADIADVVRDRLKNLRP